MSEDIFDVAMEVRIRLAGTAVDMLSDDQLVDLISAILKLLREDDAA